jgi:hypothetical protein
VLCCAKVLVLKLSQVVDAMLLIDWAHRPSVCWVGYQPIKADKFSTVVVNLVRRHLIFSAHLFHFHFEPPSGAQCESCGDRPLAWVACDAAHGPKQ